MLPVMPTKHARAWAVMTPFFDMSTARPQWMVAGFAAAYMRAAATISSSGIQVTVSYTHLVSSITTVTGIVGSLIIGVVLSKVKNQPLVLVGTMVLCTVAGIIQFIFTGQAAIIVVAVLVGLFTNIVPPALFSNAQWAAKTPAGVALVMAALPIGSNFGGIPAAPIAGAIVESTGSWAMVAAPLGIVGVIGLVCSIVFMVRCGKYAMESQSK